MGLNLPFIDVTDSETERVVALPEALLEKGGLHYSEDLPFKVRVLNFGPNCEFNSLPPANKAKGPTAGVKPWSHSIGKFGNPSKAGGF
jgi:hypothetical protein